MMRDLVDQMLAIVDRHTGSARDHEPRFDVMIGSTTLVFDPADPRIDLTFERLACAIEAAIASGRARGMIAAVGMDPQPLPLWLVTSSNILAEWLTWAGAGNALRKVLTLSDDVGMAPVAGYLDRRNRWELGQGGAKIRVRGGLAIVERIELSDKPRCTVTLGQTARVRIQAHTLPETLIQGLQRNDRANAGLLLADVVSHPFFTTADLRVASVANDGSDVMFEVESRWKPLEPVPAAAWSVLPPDADPVFPWRATGSERRRLDGLVEEARHRTSSRRDPH